MASGRPPWLRYRRITVNGRRVYEHRWIVEQAVGRCLTRREHVHHINGDKLDNRPENLRLTATPAEHFGIHRRHPLTRACLHCGQQFALRTGRQRCCSLQCGGIVGARARRGAFRDTPKTCIHCSNEYIPRVNCWSAWRSSRLCSLRCSALWRWASGDGHGTAKLTRESAIEIRRLRALGLPVKELAARFGIHGTQVSHIVHGRNWR